MCLLPYLSLNACYTNLPFPYYFTTHLKLQAYQQYQDVKYVNSFMDDCGVEDELNPVEEPFEASFSRLMDIASHINADEDPPQVTYSDCLNLQDGTVYGDVAWHIIISKHRAVEVTRGYVTITICG